MRPPLSHFTSPDFWSFYKRLPANIQQTANKYFDLLKSDPKHSSLVSTQEPEVGIQESELACVYAQAGENRATIRKRISGSRVPELQEQSADYNASLFAYACLSEYALPVRVRTQPGTHTGRSVVPSLC